MVIFISTTFKTSLETIKNTIKDIESIKNTAYVGSDGLFDSATISTYKTQLQGLSRVQAEASLSSIGLTRAQQKQVLSALEVTNATKALTVGQIEERIATQLNSKEDAKAIVQKMTKAGVLSTESGVTTVLTFDILEQARANGVLTTSEVKTLASAFGLTMANTTLSTSFKILTASILASIKAFGTWLVTNPIGIAILSGTAMLGLAKAVDHYTVTVEEAKEKTEEAISSYESISSEVETLENKIASLEEQIKGLDPITNEKDIENLKLETAELNNQLKILKEKERIAKEEADTAAQTSLTTKQESSQKFTKDYRYDAVSGGFIEVMVGEQVTQAEELKLMMTRYKEVLELKRKTEEELSKMTEAETYSQEEWDKLNASVERYESELTGLEKSMNTTALSLSEQAEGLIGAEGKSKELKEETTGLITEYNNLIDSVNGATDALNTNAEAQGQTEPEKWSFSETIAQLDTAKEKLSTLDETYAKLFDGDKTTNIGFDDFSAINEAFSDVTDIDNYIQRLQEAGQNTEQVTAVMEDLISAYLEQSNILSNVTDENKNLIATMLQEMGVANAVKLVEDALIATTNARALEESYLAQTGNVLIEQSWEKIESFLNEAKASEVAKQEIALLKLEQMDLQNNPLDLSSNISEILTVAKAAKLAKDELAQLKELEYAQKMATETKSSYWTDRYYQLANEVKDIGSNIEDVEIEFDPVVYKGGSSTSKAIKDAAKDASESAKSEFKETIDFFETGIKKLEDSLSLLEASVENVTGSLAKNKLISAQIDLNAQKMNGYASALEMYSEKANEALSGIPEELRDKVINGAISIDTFIGSNNEQIVENIKEYQKWNDKLQEVNLALAELKETIRDLMALKFSNIKEDFSNQFDIRDNVKSLIDKQISLLEEMDSIDYGGFYKAQIFQTEKQLELLNKEKQALTEQMNESVASGWVQEGSDEWLEMANAITEVDSQILDCQIDIESMNNTIKELEVEKFENLAKYFDDGIEVLANTNNMLEKEISLLEESGKIVDEALYKAQITNEEQNLALLKRKQEVLTTQMADSLSSGVIEKGSEEWHTMNDAINEVNEAIVDTKLNIEEMNNAITQLEVDKFERIEEHFDSLNNVLDNSNNSIQQYIELLEKSGEFIDDSMYVAQIKNEEDKIAFFEQKKENLERQLAESVASGKIEKNSDEWKEMNDAIVEVDSSIMDSKIRIEDLNNSITQLEVDKFERMSGHFNELNDVLDDSNNSIKQNISLLEESGEVIDDSMYLAQIKNEEKRLSLLEAEKDALEKQLELSVATGYIEENSDEWKEMMNTISEIDSSIMDSKISIEELNNSITQLEVDKFNRMNDYFSELTDVLDDSNNSIKQNISLLEESGEVIDDSMYVAQIENEERKLSLLQQQKDALEKQLELSVKTGYIEENSEEWKEMADTITEIDNAILDSKTSIEELNNAITQLEVDKFERISDYFSKVTDVIDDSNTAIQKQISLLEESGDIVNESLYQAQILNEENKIAFLKAEKEELEKQLAESISLGYIEKGSDEWHTMTDTISEVSDAILDCQINIEEFNNTIKELEVQKFERISEHFQSLSDVLDNSNNLIQKQIGLLEESGKIVGKSYYTAQIENEQQRLELLNQQKDALTKQMNESLSKGLIEEGSEEWLSMIESINETDSSILDCKTSIEELDNAILDLEWETFERIQDSFSNLNSELENLIGLFNDADIADENGIWTNEAIAQLGLLAQQYELAVYQSEQYKKEIEKLNADYSAGKYSATEYSEKLAELNQSQWDCVNSSQEILNSVVELNKIRVEKEIEGINEQVEAYEKLIDAQIKALDSEKD